MRRTTALILFCTISLSIFSQDYNLENDPNLLMYFDFEQFNEDTVIDKSNNSYKGIIQNKQIANGVIGSCIELDNSKISIPSVSRVANYTSMAWIYITDYGSSSNNMLVFEKSSAYYMNILSVTQGNKTRGKLRVGGHFEGSPSWRYLDSPNTVPLNEWFHAAATLNNGVYKVYINGEKVAEQNGNSNLIETDNEFTWGALWKASATEYRGWFSGKLDECAIISAPLNDDDIASYYNQFIVDGEKLLKKDNAYAKVYQSNSLETLNIKVNEIEAERNLNIYSSTGRLIHAQKFNNNELKITRTDLSRGVVCIIISDNSQNMLFSTKFMVQ